MADIGRPIQRAHVGIFLLVSLIIFLVSFSIVGGVYWYVHTLTRKVAVLDADIATRKPFFDLGSINKIKRLETRLNAATAILGNHVAFSKFFPLLENSTNPKVAFRSLKYSVTQDGLPTIVLKGAAEKVDSLALQSDAFLLVPEFKNQSFGEYKSDSKKAIEFTFTATVDPAVIKYTPEVPKSTDATEHSVAPQQ